MSGLMNRLKHANESITMRDILVANVLHYTSTDEIAEELNNRLLGESGSADFKAIKNNLLIDELTQRLTRLGTIVTTAAILDDIGKNTTDMSFIKDTVFGTSSHVTSSWGKI